MQHQTPHRPSNTRSATGFTKERGPGAFVSLGSLPKRNRPPQNTNLSKKSPVFHFKQDGDEDEEGTTTEDDEVHKPPSLKSHSRGHFRLSIDTGNSSEATEASVPFPQSGPLSPLQASPDAVNNLRSLPVTQFHATAGNGGQTEPETKHLRICRTPSNPIFLSNGKPLKPSLKSSSSAPSIPDSLRPMHLRAQSAPSTPALHSKNVHFAEKDHGLESVRVFSQSAKPRSITTGGDDTETETEPESNVFQGRLSGFGKYADSFPFPRIPNSYSVPKFEIDPEFSVTSPIPSPTPSPYANVYLERIELNDNVLVGAIIVRNLAFEKRVAVRFTLDDWQTTSEVSSQYVVSLDSLPPTLFKVCHHTLGDTISVIARSAEGQRSWDRFRFTIRLDDYIHNLQDRVLWLVVRFSAAEHPDYWDNNSGKNYRIGFRIKKDDRVGHRAVRKTVHSAPSAISRATQPPTGQVSSVTTKQGSPPCSPFWSPSGFLNSTSNRLPKLNLKNYAAPSPTACAMPPLPHDQPKNEESFSDKLTLINGHPATIPPSPSMTGSPPLGSRNHVRGGSLGIGLHWPWGSINLTPAGSGAASAASDSGSGSERGPAKWRPPSPPKARAQASPPSSASESAASSPSNSQPPSPPRQPSPLRGMRTGSPALPSDAVYNTIVKQWCFVQSPSPAHGAGMSAPGLSIGGVV